MEEIKSVMFAACSSLIIGEIIYYLTPKDKVVKSIYALLYTVIIVSSVLSLINIEWNFEGFYSENSFYQDEIDEQISSYYTLNTEKELVEMIEDSLGTVHITCESIDVAVIVDEESVSIEKINVVLTHSSDVKNAVVILNSIFGDVIPMEVTSEA